jgi:hypothetical protein
MEKGVSQEAPGVSRGFPGRGGYRELREGSRGAFMWVINDTPHRQDDISHQHKHN